MVELARSTNFTTTRSADVKSLPLRPAGRQEPRPHQTEAIGDALEVLRAPGEDVRATCVLPCGTGKTLVGLRVSEGLGRHTLLAEPSLALVAQNLRSWRGNFLDPNTRILVVCSDRTVTHVNRDEAVVRPEEIGAPVTRSVDEVRAFLKDRSTPSLLVTTYHSTPLLARAMRDRQILPFDAAVCDEAHRTATHEDSRFATVLSQANVRSRTRLFLTATPKVYAGSSEGEVHSMCDTGVYGTRAHTLSFGRAIELGLLTDYRVVVGTMTRDAARRLLGLKARAEVSDEAVAAVALAKAVGEYGLTKLISYHRSVEAAGDFPGAFAQVFRSIYPGRKLWAESVNGRMEGAVRQRLIGCLEHEPASTFSLLSNCRVLVEGVDVPAVDALSFFDRRNSVIEIIQAIGRVMRTSSGKSLGTIFLPVLVQDGDDPDAVLSSSNFQTVWRVLRALRSHDERVEVVCQRLLRAAAVEPDRRVGEETTQVAGFRFDLRGLEGIGTLRDEVRTRAILAGSGHHKPLLSEAQVRLAAKRYFDLHKKLPSSNSKEAVPGMPDETWAGIQQSGFARRRGLSSTLAEILKPLRAELGLPPPEGDRLTVSAIRKAARLFYREHRRLPTSASTEAVPGMPDDTWNAIHRAGLLGYRGLRAGQTLSVILSPIRDRLVKTTTLTEAAIVAAAREYHSKHLHLPTSNSHDSVPGLRGWTWAKVEYAGKHGTAGLEKGRTLRKILGPLREELKPTEPQIVEAALRFRDIHKRFPTQASTEEVPGMPDRTWGGLNAQLKVIGKSLSVVLAPYRNQ